jgi:hypothetical protein
MIDDDIEEIDLNDDEEAALEAAWDELEAEHEAKKKAGPPAASGATKGGNGSTTEISPLP